MNTQDLPLSKGQEGLYHLHRMAPESPAYNVGFSMGDGGEPTRHSYESPVVDFEQTDASTWNEEELKRQVKDVHILPFDLAAPSLFRARLFRRSETEQVFLLTVHHIVFDELERLYLAEINNTGAELPAIPVEYTDFIREQAMLLDSPKGERLRQYWQGQLAGDLPVLDLPTDHPRPPRQSCNGATS